MKKIFAIALVIVMMAAISIPAFAAEVNGDANGTLAPSTTVKYGVDQTYTVEIPETISLTEDAGEGKKSGTGDIVISAVCIPANAHLVLTVDSSVTPNATDAKWLLKEVPEEGKQPTGALPVQYVISGVQKQADVADVTYATIAKGGTLMNVASAVDFKAATTTLTFTADKTMQVANYEDQLTFTVAISA